MLSVFRNFINRMKSVVNTIRTRVNKGNSSNGFNHESVNEQMIKSIAQDDGFIHVSFSNNNIVRISDQEVDGFVNVEISVKSDVEQSCSNESDSTKLETASISNEFNVNEDLNHESEEEFFDTCETVEDAEKKYGAVVENSGNDIINDEWDMTSPDEIQGADSGLVKKENLYSINRNIVSQMRSIIDLQDNTVLMNMIKGVENTAAFNPFSSRKKSNIVFANVIDKFEEVNTSYNNYTNNKCDERYESLIEALNSAENTIIEWDISGIIKSRAAGYIAHNADNNIAVSIDNNLIAAEIVKNSNTPGSNDYFVQSGLSIKSVGNSICVFHGKKGSYITVSDNNALKISLLLNFEVQKSALTLTQAMEEPNIKPSSTITVACVDSKVSALGA